MVRFGKVWFGEVRFGRIRFRREGWVGLSLFYIETTIIFLIKFANYVDIIEDHAHCAC